MQPGEKIRMRRKHHHAGKAAARPFNALGYMQQEIVGEGLIGRLAYEQPRIRIVAMVAEIVAVRKVD
jgi:hypothetical protein